MNGDKSNISVDNIIKTDIPQQTLDLINKEKQGAAIHNKSYEFHIITKSRSNPQAQERIYLVAMNYEELKRWIVGINQLSGNKNNLTRLASLIQS
mmetsp:Transcript_23463/g.23122  ORF Transcript_23463/g.23122 Transcript_23463/m.23122 type:complete len:95 (+) Transcript_23463:1418-1702(+)